jgi:hypothetical protein
LKLDVSSFMPGIYFVKIANNNSVQTLKLIVNKKSD